MDATITTPLGVHRVRQARSQATRERIVGAAVELLERKPLEEISVAEIARRAGISVGGFYARFASRDALFHTFENGFFERILADADRVLDPRRWEGRRIPEIIEAYIRMAVTVFRKHEGILRQVAVRSRGRSDPKFRERINRLNQHLHDRFRVLLHARSAEISHPDPRVAIDLGLTFVSAAMRETILFSHMCQHLARLSDDALVEELTHAYCAFLGVRRDRSAGSRKRRSR